MSRVLKDWKVLSTEYLMREPWMTVRRQRMLLPNGNVIPAYYVLEYPTWICTVAITKDGKMLMVKQFRVGIGRFLVELCAGVMDSTDKSPMAAAQRELLEETGYGSGQWRLLTVTSANPGTHNNLTYCYLATDVEPISDAMPEATEDLSVEIMEQEEVFAMLQNNEVMQSMHSTALWKYFYEKAIASKH